MLDFDQLASAFPNLRILCVGDLMLDDFVYGEVGRISPEAPAPVLAVSRSSLVVGGAGNVARNIAGLGATCIFVGLIGDDSAADTLLNELRRQDGIVPRLVVDRSRPTTRKVRFVSEHFSTHLLRADWEVALPASVEIEDELIDKARAALADVQVVVLSDYAKGVLTRRVVRDIIAAANDAGKPVIVDPKSADLSIYRGASLLTPNRKELAEATRMPVGSDEDLVDAARLALANAGGEALLVTRSEDGMSLVGADGGVHHVPAYAVKVRDVSGAGDTVAAALACCRAAGADWADAMRVANAAASVVVGKPGTASVSVAELRMRVLPHASFAAEEKIVVAPEALDERLASWRAAGLRIGFTNGCFDLLHPGHIRVLTAARASCDRLVVGLNSDASVRRLKGESRPLQNERARAEVLAALEAVDLVCVFGEDTPLRLIERVRPAVLVKGGDYTPDQVVGRDIVEAGGGEVVIVDLVPGASTTSLVARASNGPAGAAKATGGR